MARRGKLRSRGKAAGTSPRQCEGGGTEDRSVGIRCHGIVLVFQFTSSTLEPLQDTKRVTIMIQTNHRMKTHRWWMNGIHLLQAERNGTSKKPYFCWITFHSPREIICGIAVRLYEITRLPGYIEHRVPTSTARRMSAACMRFQLRLAYAS